MAAKRQHLADAVPALLRLAKRLALRTLDDDSEQGGIRDVRRARRTARRLG